MGGICQGKGWPQDDKQPSLLNKILMLLCLHDASHYLLLSVKKII